MYFVRKVLAVICFVLSLQALHAQSHLSDSLQQVLAKTSEPQQRIQLLLNLKDLHSNSNLELPYSIRLFREAAAIGDTYAMSTAVMPIIERYATYEEKRDSLRYYILALNAMTPGTPEEGMNHLAEMTAGHLRLRETYNPRQAMARAREAIAWCDSISRNPTSIYEKVKILMLRATAHTTIGVLEKNTVNAYLSQIGLLEEAYELTRQMPQINTRKAYASQIYFNLSYGYNLSIRLADQEKLIRDYLGVLDRFYVDQTQRTRRPYLYAYANYSMPYQQLMLCAYNARRMDMTDRYLAEFNARMLDCKAEDLPRNKARIYETGYLWNGFIGRHEIGIQYCDSLIQLAGSEPEKFGISGYKMFRMRFDHARLLDFADRYEESYAALDKTSQMLDSLMTAEGHERAQTIRRYHDMDRLKLSETRAVIRNRAIITGSVIGIGLLLTGFGIYLIRILRANKRLQKQILHHSRKAQESEHMKSAFVNTICRGIAPPLNAIERSAQSLIVAGMNASSLPKDIDQIQTNTKMLLSTLDNMLEASNLDSLTDRLTFKQTDINELCSAEVILASRLHENSGVSYIIEAPKIRCYVRTHAKYFSFVVRALLDNAGKFTTKGSITLQYELLTQENRLRLTVTDTGCGIPPERHKEIFSPRGEHSAASHGLSLSLCRQIAEHLAGTISLDESYQPGARFIFIVPIKP